MDINKHIQDTIEKIKSECEREIAIVKQRVSAEKIAPEKAKIDQKKNESCIELNIWLEGEKKKAKEEYDAIIENLNAKYIKDKNSIIDSAEKKKQEIESSIMMVETCEIVSKKDEAIAKLSALLENKE